MCFRYNSSAATSTSWPSPWKSPTRTDKRRNESVWKQQRCRLLPSSAHRHFILNSTETVSPSPSIHEDPASGTGHGPSFFQSINTHTHNHRATIVTPAMGGPRGSGFRHCGMADLVEPMRFDCFLRKCASVMRTGAMQAHVNKQTNAHTQTCITLLSCGPWQVFQTHKHT